jgi:hypothetical protein
VSVRVPKTPEDWTPDEQLADAVLAGSSVTLYDLCPHDRAWVIAALKLRGLTAEQIEDRLGGSLRLVRQIASEPGATMARLYLIEREAFADTLRMFQADVARLDAERREQEMAAQRYKLQLDRMIARLALGDVEVFPKCGHPRTRYNTYVAPKTGKKGCRRCRTQAQARYRARGSCAGGVDNGAWPEARAQRRDVAPGVAARSEAGAPRLHVVEPAPRSA